MSTTVEYNNELVPGQVASCHIRNYKSFSSTGALLYAYDSSDLPFFHSSNMHSIEAYKGTANNVFVSEIDKKFISLQQSFKTQFESLKNFYKEIDFEAANKKFSFSLSQLFEAHPDIIFMELTHEQSVFYTIKKDEYTFYIQHFLNEVDDDDDEAILTVFKGNDKLPSYAGGINKTIYELKCVLSPSKSLTHQLDFA